MTRIQAHYKLPGMRSKQRQHRQALCIEQSRSQWPVIAAVTLLLQCVSIMFNSLQRADWYSSQVGPVIKKKVIMKSEINEQPKCQCKFKTSDIPIRDNELAQWDLIVRSVLDWAGTLPDTFGTNEHPDLLDTVQSLWEKCLPERQEDVRKNPAVKKVVSLMDHKSAIITTTDPIIMRSLVVSTNGKACSERRPSWSLMSTSGKTPNSARVQVQL